MKGCLGILHIHRKRHEIYLHHIFTPQEVVLQRQRGVGKFKRCTHYKHYIYADLQT